MDDRTTVRVALPDNEDLDTIKLTEERVDADRTEQRQRILDRYVLEHRLGSGGFSTVYAAYDERLSRRVAVKVIADARADQERIEREAHAAARLDHPAIVKLFDCVEADGVCYLISELVEGQTLAALISAGELSDRDIVRIGYVLAEALAHAHDRGVIHRDVKPQNILVPRGQGEKTPAKLTDFGIALLAGKERLTGAGDVVGTLAYMAPEQASGKQGDERVDLYSLGLVLYEAFAGRNPVRAKTPLATVQRIGSNLPSLRRSRKDLPADLCAAIDACVSARPQDRGDLEQLQSALGDALAEVSDVGRSLPAIALERTRARPAWTARIVAGVAGALLYFALVQLIKVDLLHKRALELVVVAALIALFPRLGWLLSAGVVIVSCCFCHPPLYALAVLLTFALVPVLLLARSGQFWSFPGAVFLLNCAGLGLMFPAVVVRVAGIWRRGTLALTAAWWALLLQPFVGEHLLPRFGRPPRSAGRAFDSALTALASAPVLTEFVLWAVAAALLPLIVRGQSLLLDAVIAGVWASALLVVQSTLVAHFERVQFAPNLVAGVLPAVLSAIFACVAARWKAG